MVGSILPSWRPAASTVSGSGTEFYSIQGLVCSKKHFWYIWAPVGKNIIMAFVFQGVQKSSNLKDYIL